MLYKTARVVSDSCKHDARLLVVADWLKSQRTMSAAKRPPFTKDSKVAIIGGGALFSQHVRLLRRQSTADLSQRVCLLSGPFATARNKANSFTSLVLRKRVLGAPKSLQGAHDAR
jgi:hypothetical protein